MLRSVVKRWAVLGYCQRFLCAVVTASGLAIGLGSFAGAASGASTRGHAAQGAPLHVGFLFSGPIDDGAYNELGFQNMQAIKRYFGKRITVSYVPSIVPGPDATQAVTKFVQSGVKLILSESTGSSSSVASEMTTNPSIKYYGYFDTLSPKSPHNIGAWSAEGVGPCYVLGMMLAAASKTNKIGFVASFPIPTVNTETNGLLLGARAINPKMTVHVVYVNSFGNPSAETVAAKALIASGAGALATSNNDAATGVAAESAGVPFASVGLMNGSHFAPKEYLDSAYFDNFNFWKYAIQQALQGHAIPRDVNLGGFGDGAFTLAKAGPAYSRLVSKHDRAKIAAAYQRLKAGRFNPYTGPIRDQAGKLVIPAGHKLSFSQSSTMPWLVSGITASK